MRHDSSRRAIVSDAIRWIDAKLDRPPTGCKLLVINKDQGIALLTHWSNDYGWTHWHPLPTFDKHLEFKQ